MTLNGWNIFLNLMVDFIKSYNDESDEGYFLFDAQYPENLDNFHNGLPFFA